MKIAEKLNGKKILIWGFGREGKATKNFIEKHCKSCTIEILEGGLEEIDFDAFDYIIKSPGIKCELENKKLTSQTDLFMEEFRDQIVGITGTKGKSTTASMLYHVLLKCGVQVVLVGNIGMPCLDYYDEIDKNTVIVFEMSCHQLAHSKQSPHIAVMLNIYEDHLDYYGTMEKYLDAKLHILRYQKEGDLCIINKNMSVPTIIGRCIKIDPLHLRHSFHMKLKGNHNQYNAETVFIIAVREYHLKEDTVRNAIGEFGGLSHRQEFIGIKQGISYYDDSISTICESAIQAVESIPNIQTLLIGGMDRGIDYSILVNYLKKKKELKVICMYASGKNVFSMLSGRKNTFLCDNLEQAVRIAKRETESGHACVLSPAAASYDHFKNFEERGEIFRKFVME